MRILDADCQDHSGRADASEPSRSAPLPGGCAAAWDGPGDPWNFHSVGSAQNGWKTSD